ncbi:fatty acid desaturase [bacterium]|nr:fatty acid desaturase [bacterium]
MHHTTLGLLRGMAHGSYKLHPVLNVAFRLVLRLAVGIKWWAWCRVHQYHHMHTETAEDGHSPMYKGGISGVLLHNPELYQASADSPEVIAAVGDRFKPDAWDRYLFDHELLGRVLGIVLYRPTFEIVAGVVAYVVHIFTYIYLNAAINSLGHGAESTGVSGKLEQRLTWICQKTGKRPGYDPETAEMRLVGNSLNLQWLAWITMGEGLHYNHHFSPRSPTMRRFRGEHDPGLYVLRILCAVSLVSGLSVPRSLRTQPH